MAGHHRPSRGGGRMSQFLLVHGAFHGAWCWRKTVAELEKRGHRAKAIDLPGQGEDRTPLKEVTLDTMVDKIIAEMADLPGKVVLVGHSLGGIARQIESVGEHRLRKREFGRCSSNELSNRCRIGIRHLPSRRAA